MPSSMLIVKSYRSSTQFFISLKSIIKSSTCVFNSVYVSWYSSSRTKLFIQIKTTQLHRNPQKNKVTSPWFKTSPVSKPNHFPYKYPNILNPSYFHPYPPMKMEQTDCSETSAYKIQTPGNCPEKSIQQSYIFWDNLMPRKIAYKKRTILEI